MVKDLEQIVKGAQSLVFVNFHGMNVGDETMLRRNLRDKEVGYRVSRKTLLKRALSGKAKGELPELAGEVAIAYLPAVALAKAGSGDDTKPAREVYNFQKTHKGILSILGGIFEGEFIGKEKMMDIAMIPSREVLYAKLVNILNWPIQRFAAVLSEIAKNKGSVS